MPCSSAGSHSHWHAPLYPSAAFLPTRLLKPWAHPSCTLCRYAWAAVSIHQSHGRPELEVDASRVHVSSGVI